MNNTASLASRARPGTAHAAAASPAAAAVPAQPALVPAVARALTLLERIAQARTPLTLARLAADLGYPKSSVHGLCNTLLSFGYLRRQADGAFLIGARVMGLAEAFVSGTQVTDEFNALWQTAHGGAHDETIILSVLNGADVVYVAARPGRRPLGLAFNVGMRLPAHLAATGKAMLAYQPAGRLEQIFKSEPLARMSGKGPLTRAALKRELRATRERGYSIDDEGVREGVYCMGAPVFDATGQAVAGVGVCINKSMLGTDGGARHLQVVLGTARELTQRLGGAVPPAPPSDNVRQGGGA
ncbi:IclR family transcriptional regulator [Azohydromonas aeria]|uniref:IclR family transcriptional regulator n=1 Tax=Azohydromonas aeria TaxID=2590212 RepID=UPI001E29106A|nr:IclR family transcriptional regulator [Azohydromonas aeria]